MPPEFSSSDIRFIESVLAYKSTDFIAQVLRRPVDQVRQKIHSMTGGSVPRKRVSQKKQVVPAPAPVVEKKRLRPILEYTNIATPFGIADEVHGKKPAGKKKRKFKPVPLKVRQRQHKRERLALEAKIKATKKLNEPPKFETRSIDQSQLVPIRIDARTQIFIKKGEDRQLAIDAYLKRKEEKFKAIYK